PVKDGSISAPETHANSAASPPSLPASSEARPRGKADSKEQATPSTKADAKQGGTPSAKTGHKENGSEAGVGTDGEGRDCKEEEKTTPPVSSTTAVDLSQSKERPLETKGKRRSDVIDPAEPKRGKDEDLPRSKRKDHGECLPDSDGTPDDDGDDGPGGAGEAGGAVVGGGNPVFPGATMSIDEIVHLLVPRTREDYERECLAMIESETSKALENEIAIMMRSDGEDSPPVEVISRPTDVTKKAAKKSSAQSLEAADGKPSRASAGAAETGAARSPAENKVDDGEGDGAGRRTDGAESPSSNDDGGDDDHDLLPNNDNVRMRGNVAGKSSASTKYQTSPAGGPGGDP
ncbi:unnamed protein product, partial [Sphacelaria rigidula]